MALPRWFAHFIARPAVSPWALRLATWVDAPIMRASRGRLRLSFVIPLLLLRCRGHRSGAVRDVPLLYVPDGDRMSVVASNGGRALLPAWCHNLRARPRVDVVLGGRQSEWCARELDGAARARAFALAVDLYPGYARYAARLTREIPVFELEAR